MRISPDELEALRWLISQRYTVPETDNVKFANVLALLQRLSQANERWTVREDTYTAILFCGKDEIYRVSRYYKADLERIAYRANHGSV